MLCEHARNPRALASHVSHRASWCPYLTAHFLDVDLHAPDTLRLLAEHNMMGRTALDPQTITLICVHIADDGSLHAARVGHGPQLLYLFNGGDRHFRPLLRRRRGRS